MSGVKDRQNSDRHCKTEYVCDKTGVEVEFGVLAFTAGREDWSYNLSFWEQSVKSYKGRFPEKMRKLCSAVNKVSSSHSLISESHSTNPTISYALRKYYIMQFFRPLDIRQYLSTCTCLPEHYSLTIDKVLKLR